ncbi:hypothetical protein ACOYXF_14365 [Pseudomonas sp. Tul1A2]
MSSSDDELRYARAMVWINNVFGGGTIPRREFAPEELISEELTSSALESFNSISNSVDSGNVGFDDKSASIVDFKSSAFRAVKITLVNNSPFSLVRFKYSKEHSNWMGDVQPPESIAPGHVVVWGVESNGVAAGTEGWVEYLVCGDYKDAGPQNLKMSFKVYWDNPAIGSNSRHHSWPLGDESNPIWNKVTLKDPDEESIGGDHCRMKWVFQYLG